MKKRFLALLILLSSQLFFGQQRGLAWVLQVETKPLPDYLQRRGSKINPIVKVSVAYSDTFDEKAETAIYEDLFYGAEQPIGCVQHGPLAVTNGTRGAIYLDSAASQITPEELAILGNTIKRIYLDLYMKDCQVRDVVIPSKFYDAIVSSFQKRGFHELPSADSQEPMNTLILLHFVSQPAGLSGYLRL